MNTEYEATFPHIDIEEMRILLRHQDAQLIRPMRLQKRAVFEFPSGHEIPGGFIRVRDEGDASTMSAKVMQNTNTIAGQKEIDLQIDNYEHAINFLLLLGATQKAIQHTKREVWHMKNTYIMLDERPFLHPFVEIEGENETAVRASAQDLGLEWHNAIFGAVDIQYANTYGISKKQINDHTPLLIFDMENPFIGNSTNN